MSVTNTTPIAIYTADGITTSFALNFEVEGKDNIKVTANNLLVSKNDYNYSSINNAINFYQPVASGTEIKIERITDLERSEDYTAFSNSFRPETLNYDFNRIWRALQERGVQNSEALTALINTLSTLSERDRTVLDAVQAQALEDIKEDTGVADLIKSEAETRKKSDEAYNLLAALEAGKTLPELKEYVDNILGIKNPNLLTGITSRLIVDHETGETVKNTVDDYKNHKEQAVTVVESEADLNNLDTWQGQSVYVKDTGLFINDNGFKYQYDKYSAPCIYAKDIQTDGTDQLAKLKAYAQLAASQKLKLILPKGTITINDEFIPPSGLVMEGFNSNASVGQNMSGTTIKWGGSNGTKKAVIRCSTSAIGTTPTSAISGTKIEGIRIDATGCDYGLYLRYFTNESRIDNLVVTGANLCNVAGYQLWFCTIGKVVSQASQDKGMVFGVALSGETGDLAVNGIKFEYLRLHTNGRNNLYDPISNKFSGVGLYINTQGCEYGMVQSEGNGGIGIIDSSVSRTNKWNTLYLENNCTTDTVNLYKTAFYVPNAGNAVRHVTLDNVTLASKQQIVNDSAGQVNLHTVLKVVVSDISLSGTGKGFKIFGDQYPLTEGLSKDEYLSQVYYSHHTVFTKENVNIRYGSQLPQQSFYLPKNITYPYIVLIPRSNYVGTGTYSLSIDGEESFSLSIDNPTKGNAILLRRPNLTKGLHTIEAKNSTLASDLYCDIYISYGKLPSDNVAKYIDF